MPVKIELDRGSEQALLQQAQKLVIFDRIAQKHYRNAMKMAVLAVKLKLGARVPIYSGQAMRDLSSKVQSKNVTTRAFGFQAKESFVLGRVGWFGKIEAWYINVVEHGRKPGGTQPPPEPMTELARGDETQGFLIGRAIAERGFEGKFFMRETRETANDDARPFIQQASRLIVDDLALQLQRGP